MRLASCISIPSSSASPLSSPAVSANAWQWAGRSSGSRCCSCSTNRSRTSMRSLRVEMRAEIKALHQRLRSTTIYVTHDQVEAMTMADLVVVMNDGRIEQLGRPLELYDQPATVFVADFLGSPAMNLITGTVTEGGSGSGGRCRGRSDLADLSEHRPAAGGRKSSTACGPEHVRIGDGQAGLPATVTLVEPAGFETHLHADIGGHVMRVISTERLDVVPGDSVSLVPDAMRVHLFDSRTGKRLQGGPGPNG